MTRGIVVCGAPRSASTLAYNVSRFFLEALGETTVFGVAIDKFEMAARRGALNGAFLLKTHDVSRAIDISLQYETALVYTFRDPLEIIKSGMRIFGWTESEAILQAELFLAQRKVVAEQGLQILEYAGDPDQLIDNVLRQLMVQFKVALCPSEVRVILEKLDSLRPPEPVRSSAIKNWLRSCGRRLPGVKKLMAKRWMRKPKEVIKSFLWDYDEDSLLHPEHRSTKNGLSGASTVYLSKEMEQKVRALAEHL